MEISSLILQAPSFPFFLHSLPPQSNLPSCSWCEGNFQLREKHYTDPCWKLQENRVSCWPGEAGSGCHGRGVSVVPDHGPVSHLCSLQTPALPSHLDHRPCLNQKDFLKALSSRTKRRKDLFPWLRAGITVILGLNFFITHFGYLVSALAVQGTLWCVCVYVCVCSL